MMGDTKVVSHDVMLIAVRMQCLLVSPRMIADHSTTSVLRALKAVNDRLAKKDDAPMSGQDHTQGSSHVAPADTLSSDEGGSLAKQAALGAVFDLV